MCACLAKITAQPIARVYVWVGPCTIWQSRLTQLKVGTALLHAALAVIQVVTGNLAVQSSLNIKQRQRHARALYNALINDEAH